jgi:hypothetical protein
MYGYAIDGKIVTPSRDAYAITNQSNCPIQITSITGKNEEWTLTKSDPSQKEQLRLTIGGQVVTTDALDTSGDKEWKIKAPKEVGSAGVSLKLKIQAEMAGENVNNQEEEVNACAVTYVTKIAE